MLRIRKLVLAIAAASALSSGVANALGLGELTLKSAQNQPLDAEIELLDVRDLTAAQMAPSLAPPEEFAKAGVAFPPYLEDLTFTPVINPNGRSVLRVTSSKALPEPVVKFLVQVMWPQGRLLRDYSVLLDQAKAQGSEAAQANVNPPVSTGSYTTKRRDTLWQIAARNSNGGSIQQTMLAIQALNPDAFIGNNINQLKTGQVLRLPDQQQVQSIPQAEANREVAEQYAAWREGRRLGPRARQLDATRRGEAGAAPARIAQGDNLRLVAPGGKAAAGEAKALSDKLAVAQESLDTSRRDNDELKSRMSDLQSQLDKLQRLIELKNDQLARLEAQGAAPAPTAPAALPGEPAPAQPAVNAQLTPAEPVVSPAPAAADTAPQDVAAQVPAADAPSVLDELLGNPLLLGLIAGSAFLVLLLLLLLLARKRKAQQEAEKHLRMARALAEEGERSPDLDLPPSSFEGLDVSAPSVTLAPAVVAASAAAAAAAEKPAAPAPAEAPAPAVDPRAALLAEVDESLARGRLNHAADLLEAAVASDPQRSDLRLKLMEVYARQGDQDAFAGQERKLQDNEQNQAEVAALKERFPAMLGVAAVAAGAAALAAEMDEQYVQELLQEQEPAVVAAEPEPAAPVEPEPVVAPEPEVALAPAIEEADLDSAFDLSLDDDLPVDDLSVADALDLSGLEDIAPTTAPVVEEAAPAPVAAATDADDDFEALLAQAQATPQNVDDLADFDLDVGEPQAPASAEEAPVDVAAELAAFESMPEFDPISELELPDDFDLSLSLEDDSPAAKNFASELDDVNAELDKLSQNLEAPAPAAPTFTAEDAALEPEPLDDLDFDFFSGSDEVATKLDLARAYIDMGDHQGARDILDEVVKDGDDSQRQEANEMLSRLV